MTTKVEWTDENQEELVNIVGKSTDTEVDAKTVQSAATMLEMSTRRIASKLRNMGYTVQSLAKAKQSTFTDEETDQLVEFLDNNSGAFTYKEISENFLEGKFSPKQVQGKILALELTAQVKPAEKLEHVSNYSEDDTNTLVKMANSGEFLEDIAEALGKEVNSVRGKALSMFTKGILDKIPAQKNKKPAKSADPLAELEGIEDMTVAEIAEATGKTERGIKTALTRRGISATDYDGAAKAEKARARKEAAA